MKTSIHETRQYSTFWVAKLFFGIEVIKVQEIIRKQDMTIVPLASNAIEGLINLRGQIVIAIDTRRSLGLPSIEGEDLRTNIVIRSEDSAISLLVDEIGDVIDVPLNAYAPVPDNMPLYLRELIECVFDLTEGVMLVLNISQILQNACN